MLNKEVYIMFFIRIVLEILMVLLIVYGILNEDKLVYWEDDLIEVIKWIKKHPKKAWQNFKAFMSEEV